MSNNDDDETRPKNADGGADAAEVDTLRPPAQPPTDEPSNANIRGQAGNTTAVVHVPSVRIHGTSKAPQQPTPPKEPQGLPAVSIRAVPSMSIPPPRRDGSSELPGRPTDRGIGTANTDDGSDLPAIPKSRAPEFGGGQPNGTPFRATTVRLPRTSRRAPVFPPPTRPNGSDPGDDYLDAASVVQRATDIARGPIPSVTPAATGPSPATIPEIVAPPAAIGAAFVAAADAAELANKDSVFPPGRRPGDEADPSWRSVTRAGDPWAAEPLITTTTAAAPAITTEEEARAKLADDTRRAREAAPSFASDDARYQPFTGTSSYATSNAKRQRTVKIVMALLILVVYLTIAAHNHSYWRYLPERCLAYPWLCPLHL